MAAFSTWQSLKTDLIRKSIGGSLFVNTSTATLLTAITGTSTGDLVTFPAGWTDAGLMTDEGMQFARSVELSEITSFGQSTPTRSDVSTDEETVQVTLQQTSKLTIAMFTGAAIGGLTPDATSGELVIAKPATPPARNYQILALSVDNNAAGDIYVGRYFPYATVTDFSDQAFNKGDNALEWGLTLKAQLHPTGGFASKWFFGGPGWKSIATSVGFA